jgi:lipoprotein signal peptidase
MTAFLVSGVFVWALDRMSKAFVYKTLRSSCPIHLGIFSIRPTLNQQSHHRLGSRSLLLLWILALGAAMMLIKGIGGGAHSTTLAQIALGAAIGGGAGNLYDRWRLGAIQDIMDLKFTVFNIADVAIIFGVSLTILRSLVQ